MVYDHSRLMPCCDHIGISLLHTLKAHCDIYVLCLHTYLANSLTVAVKLRFVYPPCENYRYTPCTGSVARAEVTAVGSTDN